MIRLMFNPVARPFCLPFFIETATTEIYTVHVSTEPKMLPSNVPDTAFV
eukprot:SAG11_NODE_12445_length_703_cov_0.869205_1_plen_48_part_10